MVSWHENFKASKNIILLVGIISSTQYTFCLAASAILNRDDSEWESGTMSQDQWW